MALRKGFRIKEDQVFISEATGLPWRVMVAGKHYVQLRSETLSAISMRIPTETFREDFSEVIEVG